LTQKVKCNFLKNKSKLKKVSNYRRLSKSKVYFDLKLVHLGFYQLFVMYVTGHINFFNAKIYDLVLRAALQFVLFNHIEIISFL
jgi:hypothetical protein